MSSLSQNLWVSSSNGAPPEMEYTTPSSPIFFFNEVITDLEVYVPHGSGSPFIAHSFATSIRSRHFRIDLAKSSESDF